ncbi:MAG TPA: hypothetical protein VMA73_28715 [Streptosporangiaceae bacterium]|nr:hypothetical protein [Streptosporangiaceae bacterium]
MGYDDGRVACTDQGIILRNYYGPFLAKRISYDSIREVREVPNSWKQRPGGSGDFVYWLNWDPHRKHKDRALVIYLNAKESAATRVSAFRTAGEVGPQVKPVMTPDDIDQVVAELTAHGVHVSTGQAD